LGGARGSDWHGALGSDWHGALGRIGKPPLFMKDEKP
jgi:hypothetical protein